MTIPEDQVVAKGEYQEYTYGQLKETFDSVRDKKNWKNPINKEFPMKLSAEEIDKIKQAVAFFAGGFPDIYDNNNGHTVIQGRGYYGWVGA